MWKNAVRIFKLKIPGVDPAPSTRP
jgi:hypothetical protein